MTYVQKLLVLILFLGFSFSAFSQIYTGGGGIINDDGSINNYPLEVSNLIPDTLSATHGLKRVCINLTHTWDADLDIRIISPSGVNLILTSGLGGDGDNYENTCFIAESTNHIINAWAPFHGVYQPYSYLGNANNNTSGNGTWTLSILDTYAFADGGEVLDWSIEFDSSVAGPEVYTPTTLPIIVINTNNVTIPSEPKIPGTFEIIDDVNGGMNVYPGPAVFASNLEIETRGSSSQQFPKKSYSFEIQDAEGNDLEAPLLGMPKEEDWILYAPYTDKSFLRDAFTYYLGREVGGYAPRTEPCEVVLNGDYVGVYWLEEKIKRDKNRVDIKKLNPTDTLGDELTGGYILKIDRHDGDGTYFFSNYEGSNPNEDIYVVYEEPEGPDMHPLQREYIQNFYHSFENALYSEDFKDPQLGYRRYVDVNSLVDYFLVCELGHNVDAYRLSTFFYKDRDSEDSLFHLGPLWDFNLAFGNVDYCECQYVNGWAFENSTACGNTPLWWPRFMEDEYFRDRVKCRYDSLRETALSTANVMNYLNEQADILAGPAERNYQKWPILGIYVWPNNFIGQTYHEEVNYMKQWVNGRLQWMDENIMGECLPISAVEDLQESEITISPNPAIDAFAIQYRTLETSVCDVTILTLHGVECKKVKQVMPGEQIDISELASGVYIVNISDASGRNSQVKLVVP